MKSPSILVSVLGLASSVFALSAPPSGAITVGPAGTGAKYSSLAEALKDTSSNTYFIFSGKYTGQTSITRANIKIFGETSNAQAYSSNTVTFTDNAVHSATVTDAESATIRVLAAGVSLYNINVVNTFGHPQVQSQAIALSVEQGQFGCYACQLKGYQDTLLAQTGTQFYGKSYIEGAVDFIFGQDASIWVTKSTINSIGSAGECITASGRSSADSNYYVIDHSTIEGAAGIFLGRPWGSFARVMYQNCIINAAINPAGWSQWATGDPRTGNVDFEEFGNTGLHGPWPASGRAPFAKNATSAIPIGTVLGSTSWVDSNYM